MKSGHEMARESRQMFEELAGGKEVFRKQQKELDSRHQEKVKQIQTKGT